MLRVIAQVIVELQFVAVSGSASVALPREGRWSMVRWLQRLASPQAIVSCLSENLGRHLEAVLLARASGIHEV